MSDLHARWPNYCPFCGTHTRKGGTGNRHTGFCCGTCHADYEVDYCGAYPSDKQQKCDAAYVKHGGTIANREQGGVAEGESTPPRRGLLAVLLHHFRKP